MSERQWCSGRSYHGRMGFGPCSSKATSTHDGKPYCHVHDPVKAAARREKANAKWNAKFDAKNRQRELADAVRLAADAVVQAAREWKAAWHNQRYSPMEYEKAREALADAVAAHDKALAEQQEASRG